MIAHVVPLMDSEETPHTLDSGTCWCQPVQLDASVLMFTDRYVVVHRRFIDGPAIDPSDDRGWRVIRVGDDDLSQPYAIT